MDAKLINMKGGINKIILCVLVILFFSCGSINKIGSSEKEFVLAYKKTVLYGCINEATNGNFTQFSIKNNDLGTAIETAILFHSVTNEAKKLGGELSENIREINYADYEGKQPIFSDCIDFAFSKEVNSNAKEAYRKLRKTE